jgi:hypothetical protein
MKRFRLSMSACDGCFLRWRRVESLTEQASQLGRAARRLRKYRSPCCRRAATAHQTRRRIVILSDPAGYRRARTCGTDGGAHAMFARWRIGHRASTRANNIDRITTIRGVKLGESADVRSSHRGRQVGKPRSCRSTFAVVTRRFPPPRHCIGSGTGGSENPTASRSHSTRAVCRARFDAVALAYDHDANAYFKWRPRLIIMMAIGNARWRVMPFGPHRRAS